MTKENKIRGFSKLSKQDKLKYYADLFENPQEVVDELNSYGFHDQQTQKLFDEFSENTISNFHLPYNIVPDVVVNGKTYTVPMVIEECSVVAAASSSAKFWSTRGGFRAEVISTVKIGQVHFTWKGNKNKLFAALPELKSNLINGAKPITANMNKRGGGITDIELIDKTDYIENYYQLKVYVDTRDSMGANFINSCLEEIAMDLQDYLHHNEIFDGEERECEIIMAILSNYTPESIVHCYVECDTLDMEGIDANISTEGFISKFEKAVKIAEIDVHRATTHNKGIYNGIDAVAIATGNDFRAIEACGHAYAAKSGSYKSLTYFSNENGKFRYGMYVPMSVGTIGGVTGLHPLAKRSIQVLGYPTAGELMMITAAIGLANNFSAVKALVTQGIQKGHMKMHLMNILNYVDATNEEKEKALDYFKHHKVSFKTGTSFIYELRTGKKQEIAES
jgi:hydroxymethylglutaryl-CoA reductase